MVLSDAQTRGPWRKKWKEYTRLLKIARDLEGARDLAEDEAARLLEEIERALEKGTGEGETIQSREVGGLRGNPKLQQGVFPSEHYAHPGEHGGETIEGRP